MSRTRTRLKLFRSIELSEMQGAFSKLALPSKTLLVWKHALLLSHAAFWCHSYETVPFGITKLACKQEARKCVDTHTDHTPAHRHTHTHTHANIQQRKREQYACIKDNYLGWCLSRRHIYIYICRRVSFGTTLLPSSRVRNSTTLTKQNMSYSSHKQIKC